MDLLLDADGIARAWRSVADRILDDTPPGPGLAVIGIRRRGDVLAERLIPLLRDAGRREVRHGALDITLYRDDLHEIGPGAVVRKTEIPFDINDQYVILVDDVLWTGRTIRAALDALVDLGRPRAIRLAVLADRPGRELPIQADYVGLHSDTPDGHVSVLLTELDDEEAVRLQ